MAGLTGSLEDKLFPTVLADSPLPRNVLAESWLFDPTIVGASRIAGTGILALLNNINNSGPKSGIT
jgi:hypothetical protein